MFTVVVRTPFNPTKEPSISNTWYSYGPFETFARASKWAVKNVNHLPDDCWWIAQHIRVVGEQRTPGYEE